MPKVTETRLVRCHHCRQEFEVGVSAMSVSCPACSRRVVVQDLHVASPYSASSIETCGWIVVDKRGQLSATTVRVSGGMEVHGCVRAAVVSQGPVIITRTARWRGDCCAPRIEIEPGAIIEGGKFRIGTE
ncbi:MAG: polymer-forming cytoskeletal protein [Phycisphaerales bacterium]